MSALFFSAVSVAAVVIAVAGLVTIALGLRSLALASRSTKWPTAKGTVLGARIDEEVSSERDERGQERPLSTWKPVITYQYEAGGRQLEGTRISPDTLQTSDRRRAEALLAEFPVGATVDVFLDPRDPTTAYLKPGISGASFIVPAVGVGLVVLGLSMFGIVWKVSGH